MDEMFRGGSADGCRCKIKPSFSDKEFHYSHGSTPTVAFPLEIFSRKAGLATVFSAVLLLSETSAIEIGLVPCLDTAL